jgi:hypothetical protein
VITVALLFQTGILSGKCVQLPIATSVSPLKATVSAYEYYNVHLATSS